MLTRHDQTVWTFDATGRLTSIADRNGNRLVAVTDALGQVTSYRLDAAGNTTAVTDPNSHTTTTTFDALDRVLTATDALGNTTSYAYDNAGNRTSVTDALQRTTTDSYDGRNRLSGVTDALGHTTTDAYDANGNLTTLTDANSHARTSTYDVLNRLKTTADALGNTTAESYDAAGNVATVVDANGKTIRYGYDARNRLVGVDLGNHGAFDIQFTYDGAGNRSSMTDATGMTTYAYDNANRLTSVTAPTAGTVAYAYDAAGERTTLTYPSGHQVGYAYTARGQLQSVTDWLTKQTSYTYDNAGRLSAIASPNGVAGSLGYDNANRLTSLGYQQGMTSLESIGYTLNAVGVRTQMTDSTGSTTYGYDALDRLTSATNPTSQQPYLYASNTPTNLTDPSGLTPFGPGGAGQSSAGSGTGPCGGDDLINLLLSDPRDLITGSQVQTALAVLSFVPGIGTPASAVSAVLYAANGDYANATLAGLGVSPSLGWPPRSGWGRWRCAASDGRNRSLISVSRHFFVGPRCTTSRRTRVPR